MDQGLSAPGPPGGIFVVEKRMPQGQLARPLRRISLVLDTGPMICEEGPPAIVGINNSGSWGEWIDKDRVGSKPT